MTDGRIYFAQKSTQIITISPQEFQEWEMGNEVQKALYNVISPRNFRELQEYGMIVYTKKTSIRGCVCVLNILTVL
jgi:hypothetical protein